MSEKPQPKPMPGKSSPKNAGIGATPGGKAGSSAAKSKPPGPFDEPIDYLHPAQRPDEIGRLAHFRVLKVLGRGGMGTVFMAEDTRLHRIVALKVMLPSIAKKSIARDRFIREARATAAIEHDHIITIYEVRDDDGEIPYAAMQYLKGMTLEDWLRAGKTLNVPQILRIGKEIAKGLAAAHARQLIHRDIKPSNIWLDASNKGRVKILDFGLARPTNEETHLTQEGMILGTPAYMSPEQARGQHVDERCDLFSLGCVLYRLCTGKLPFTGKDAMSMLIAITSDNPAPISPANPEVPQALTDLVQKLLAKKPEERPASAKDVVHALQQIERDWIAGSKTIAGKPAPGFPIKVEEVEPALEESAITELELQPNPIQTSSPTPLPASTATRTWLLAGFAGVAVTVVSLVCCVGLSAITQKGQVQFVAEDDEARALLEANGLTLLDHNNSARQIKLGTHWLPLDKYDVDLTRLPEHVKVEPARFQVVRGTTQDVRIRIVRPVRPPLVLMTLDDAKKLPREWGTFLKRSPVEKNSLDAELVLIPPGEFLMGSDREFVRKSILPLLKKLDKLPLPEKSDPRLNPESPPHRVQITRPFYLSKTEVTVGQFKKFVVAKNYLPESSTKGSKGGTGIESGKPPAERKPEFTWLTPGPGYRPSDDHPVTNITWKDAEAFCAWLSEKEKQTYRLPTEAEWEYACRAGSTDLWSFGDDWRESNLRLYSWCAIPFKTGNPTTPNKAGLKRPNAFGLEDMHGNAAEMCSDWWSPTYYDRCVKEGIVADPKGPAPAGSPGRVLRGGSFLDSPLLMRSAYRSFLDPALGHVHVGFRVVLEIPE